MSRFINVVFLLALVLSSVGTAFAQSAPAASSDSLPLIPGIRGGGASSPLSCFDYYTFGSVKADLQPTFSQTAPGSELVFLGQIINENDYPLLEGKLSVKIFKRDSATFADGDGNPVVDQFVIVQDVTLPPRGSKEVSFTWKVPANAEAGEYYAAYFYTTSDRYNLMGLSFTDDVVGNQAQFSITNNTDPKIAKLEKTSATLNGVNHHFAAFPLKFDLNEVVTVKATIKNPSDTVKSIPLQWNQYAWDSQNDENLRNTKTELITVPANQSKEVSYVVRGQRESIVYVTATAQDLETKSILNIRYVREGVEETRINFPGITKFPLQAGEEQTLFACAHSTNLPNVAGNKLTLTLTDKGGNQIHQYKYEGDIAGAMSGFGDKFTPEKNINYATLTAKLERNGVMVEEVSMTYDCNVIDPNTCFPEESDDKKAGAFFDLITKNLQTIMLTVVLGLLLAAIAVFFIRKNKKKADPRDEGPTMTVPTPLVFLLLLLPSLFFAQGEVAEAKSVTWNKTENTGVFSYRWNYGGFLSNPDHNGWGFALQDPSINITYQADVYNMSMGGLLVTDGATIPVGTQLRFTPKSHQGSDISWAGTGYSSDSPNGYWQDPNTPPDGTCRNADYVGAETRSVASGCSGICMPDWRTFYSHIPLLVNPPNIVISHSGTAVLSCDVSQQNCTVTSVGTINSVFTFGATFGKMYYGWIGTGNHFPSAAPAYPGVDTPCTNHNDYALKYNAGTKWPYGPSRSYSSHYCTDSGNGATKCNASNTGSDYQLNVPLQTISYTLNAVTANTPPNAPTFTGPATAIVGTSPAYTAQATDPDGDQIYYLFDMDNNGTGELRNPGLPGTLLNSGTMVGGVKPQSSVGAYTYKVQAVDSKGGVSSWASYTITFTAAPAPTADLTINGSAGPLAVNFGDTLTIAWNSANAASCTKFGAGWGTGQIVGTSGSNSVTATVADTYIVSCSGATDTVVVTIINRAPAAPTINGSYGGTTVGSYGSTFSFPLQSIDPDGNTIYYEVDWDNNGTIGSGDATTANVPSGNTQIATPPWSSPGTYTFQARATDVPGNLSSPWTTHTLTINPPPPPVTLLEVRVNGGSWSTADQTVDPGDTVEFKWSATGNPVNCSGSGTGLSVSGPSGTDVVTTPAPNVSETFTASCTNTGGSTSDSIVITTNQKPNFTQPTMTLGSLGTFDAVTATYASVLLTFSTTNNGGSITKSTAPYLVEPTSMAAISGTIPTLATGPTGYTDTVTIPGPISFGNFQVKVSVDTPIASNGSVDEVTEGVADNTRTTTFTIAPPDPGLLLATSKVRVRNTETATITWSLTTPYPGLTCQTYGPGITSTSLSGSSLTKQIVAKSEYTFKCTESATGTTWQKSVWVETEGKLEEV